MKALLSRRAAAAAIGTAVAALTVAGPVRGAEAAPLPPELNLADCPPASALPPDAIPEFWQCNATVITGGQLKLGSIDQRLDSPIKLTYANGFDPVTGQESLVLGKFSAQPVRVPGGVLGIPGSDFIPLLQISALPELTTDPQFGPGYPDRAQLILNLRIKTINPLLGDTCYIGSAATPVSLRMGFTPTEPPPPNKPIEGSPPEVVQDDPPVLKTTLVDNAFAVPKSSGCGPGGLLNVIADFRAGLPSKAGNNTAVFSQLTMFKTYDQLGQGAAKYRLKKKART